MIHARKVDLRDVEQGFRALARAGGDLRGVFMEIKPFVRDDITSHFARQQGVDSDWPGLAASTKEKIERSVLGRKEGRDYRTKTRHGKGHTRAKFRNRLQRRQTKPLSRLTGQTSYSVRRMSLKASSRVPWAGAHNEGAVVGRGARLPQREFMWLSWSVLERAIQACERRLIGGWRGM